MRLALKIILIGALLVALMVPMLMLHGLVNERQQRGAEVAAEIARSSSHAQRITGPLLQIEAETTQRSVRDVIRDGARERVVSNERVLVHTVIAPATLSIDNAVSVSERRRGLFSALLYNNALSARAQFEFPAAPPLEGELISHRWLGARLVFGVGDSRGIESLEMRVAETALQVDPGSGISWLPQGASAMLPAALVETGRRFEVRLEARLVGTQSLEWTPLAGESRVGISADWPHPSFQGQRLPLAPKIDEQGFSAEWRQSRLSGQAVQTLSQCGIEDEHCAAMDHSGFGVRLVDPVDRYVKTDRAMKYALLFLVLVFGAVFFLEALRGIDVHPLQYGLTGLALAMFFLLLLSLSEHIGFGAAYGVAASACVALITAYMGAVLGGRARGIGFGALLAGLYALLYGLLQSEDYALLMGTLALFALLATVMLATRRFDWRGMSRSAAAHAPRPPGQD